MLLIDSFIKFGSCYFINFLLLLLLLFELSIIFYLFYLQLNYNIDFLMIINSAKKRNFKLKYKIL